MNGKDNLGLSAGVFFRNYENEWIWQLIVEITLNSVEGKWSVKRGAFMTCFEFYGVIIFASLVNHSISDFRLQKN